MARFSGTPAECAAEIQRRARDLRRRVHEAEKATARQGVDVAKAYSSGPYSLDTLAKMGHPYARRRPKPPMTPGIINKQRGRFWSAWRAKLGNWNAKTLRQEVRNASPEAKWMRGTSKMITRPIEGLVVAKLRRPRLERLLQAARKALTA